jgi:hypothetical protein
VVWIVSFQERPELGEWRTVSLGGGGGGGGGGGIVICVVEYRPEVRKVMMLRKESCIVPWNCWFVDVLGVLVRSVHFSKLVLCILLSRAMSSSD